MPQMYNEQIKTEFLSSYPASTQKTYRSFLSKIKPFEEKLNKDISAFTQSELTQLMNDLEIDYRATARSIGRIITKYVAFAANNGYAHNIDEFFFKVKTKWFEQFALTNEQKLFFTLNEIKLIEKACENAQDAVIIHLIFDGVLGKSASELRNLQRHHVNFETGETQLINEDGSTRTIHLTEVSLKLIQEALKEDVYIKSNGQMKLRGNVREYTDLISSEFVIRSSNTSKDKVDGAVDKHVIFRRVATIGRTLGLAHFTIKNIQRSGMLKLARDILKENEIDKVNLYILIYIAKLYNISSYRSLYTFITNENIEELYGEL